MNTHSNIHKTSDFSKLPERKSRIPTLADGFFALAILTAPGIQSAVSQPEAAQRALLAESYGKRPLSFEANRGQTDSKVQFLSRGPGYSLFLTSTEAVLTLRKGDPEHQPAHGKPPFNNMKPPKPSTAAVLRMQLQGANARAQVIGLDELPGKTNYFRGKDPKGWRTGIPSYTKVKYAGVYPGIDLIYYGNQRQLEYDFVVAPGADPKTIRLHFDGAEQLSLDANGQLVVKSAGGEVIQHKPVIYQNIGGVRKAIDGGYVLYPDKNGKTSQIGFQVAGYDASKTLTIDPVLGYSTYLGGISDFDVGSDIAVDASGNAYVAGHTTSTDFPIVNSEPLTDPSGFGADAFVTKFNLNGSVVYSTLLGNDENDVTGNSIAVDKNGNVYLTGRTGPGFPVSHPSPPVLPLKDFCDNDIQAYVAKISPDGSNLVYATCFDGDSESTGIAVDDNGNAYITGLSYSSSEFPTVSPIQICDGDSSDTFIAKLNATGTTLVYSTCLGGSNSDGSSDIALDRFGNAYVAGTTFSPDFPTVRPVQRVCHGLPFISDAFVVKLNATGTALIYSTCLGGSGSGFDFGLGIAVDRFGSAFVTGFTDSPDFPVVRSLKTCGGTDDIFVTKLNSTGTRLIYSTCLGGNGDERGNDIAVDRFGNTYVSGSVGSSDFPLVNPVQSNCNSFTGDAFVFKLNASGSGLVYSTCVGGSNGGFSDAIAIDRYGNAYIAGTTFSMDFPTKNAFQPSLSGFSDAFVTKLVGQ